MKIVYNRNIEKFKIYSTKNLFVAEANSNDSTNSSSKNGSVVSDEISVKVPKDLLMLRQKYASISSEYLALVSECELMDKLLKDMRSALFTLRVGAQTFEEYGVQPIEETLASMSQQKSHLNELCKEASGISVIIKV